MEEFRPNPFIECTGHGRCNYFSTAVSYWMATIEQSQQFKKPVQQTLKAGVLTSRVSRCVVCMRQKTNGNGFPTPPPEYYRPSEVSSNYGPEGQFGPAAFPPDRSRGRYRGNSRSKNRQHLG